MMKCLHLWKIVNKKPVVNNPTYTRLHTYDTYVYVCKRMRSYISHTLADSVRSHQLRSLFSVIKEETRAKKCIKLIMMDCKIAFIVQNATIFPFDLRFDDCLMK